jgi:hypothetical protein
MTRTWPLCKQTNKRPSGANAIAVAPLGKAEPHCDSVKPAGNVAALSEKNPPPRKSPATRLTQRRRQRRNKFWLFDRLLFSADPDFENFVGPARMLNPFSVLYCSFANFASRFHQIICGKQLEQFSSWMKSEN